MSFSANSILPDFPEAETAELCRRVLLCALPAIAEHDFKMFCDEVGYLQARMGAYFGPLQGGAYVSQGVAEAIGWLAQQGLTGVGQSSWGPTGFAFVDNAKAADRLYHSFIEEAKADRLDIVIARGRNTGASIEAMRK